METLLVVIILIILAVMAGMFVSRRFDIALPLPGKKISKAANRSNRSTAAKWRSVKIRAGLMSCKSAEGMADRIYLANEAPPLPLERCTEKECSCKYEFLDDRRCGEDRRDDFGVIGKTFQNNNSNRRHPGGRREVDKQT